MQERINELLDIVRGAWRFRWPALGLSWIVGILGWIGLFFWPDMFEASTRVFVDTRTALKPVLQGLAVEQDVNTQLNYVRQSLLGAPLLETIAKDTGLLPATLTDPRKRVKIIDDMRLRVSVAVKSASDTSGPDTSGSVYTVSYKDDSRERSLKVVQQLLQNLVENTLGGKREGSQNAQKFLETQIRDYELRLRAAENRLADFKKINIGVMPGEQGGYFPRLQTEIEAIRTVESALAVAISRRDEIKKQLHGDSAITATASSMTVTGGQGAAGGGDLQSRMRETQVKLDELLLRFTDKHPDVIAMRETLEELKRRRVSEVESLRRGDAEAIAASGASANPVYQSIQLSLNQAEIDIATLRRQLSDHRSREAEQRTALNTMPKVEAEFAQLNRDYDVNKTQFTALLTQLEKAKLGQEADTSGSVRFEIIEPPNAGYKPVSPKRSLMVIGILVAALGAGAAVAYLLQMLKPVYWSANALASATGVSVLGIVSSAFPDVLRTQARQEVKWFSAASACLLLFTVAVLIASRLGFRLFLPQFG